MDQINNMEALYIGIDIGTTATKAVCFNKQGNVLRQIVKSYEMYHPKPEWSVQKPYEILQTVKKCINEITNGIQPQFISFSAAMQSVIAIGENGKPLTDAILWADNRAQELPKNLKIQIKENTFIKKPEYQFILFLP